MGEGIFYVYENGVMLREYRETETNLYFNGALDKPSDYSNTLYHPSRHIFNGKSYINGVLRNNITDWYY